MAVNAEAIISAFALSYLTVVVVLFLSSWLRSLPFTRRFYVPKRYDVSQAVKPRRLHSGYILWIWQLVQVSENEIVSVAGLDSAVYLRALAMMWRMLGLISVWCLAVVLPINLSGREVDALEAVPPAAPATKTKLGIGRSSIYDMSGFDRCSVSNIPLHSHKLFAHVASTYVVTTIVLGIVWRYNNEMTVLRILFLASAPRGGPSHTVLVQDIPGCEYGTVPWALKEFLGSTLFRFLPASWRERLVEVVEDFVFGGLARVWAGAKARARATAARAAAHGGRGMQPRPMSRWAKTGKGGGSGGAFGGGSTSSSGEGSYASYFANYTQSASELRRVAPADDTAAAAAAAAVAPPQGSPGPSTRLTNAAAPPSTPGAGAGTFVASGAAAAGESEQDSDNEAGAEANNPPPRLPPDVAAFADRFNLELETRVEPLKVDVHTARSGALDVWEVAVAYLSQPPRPGQPPPSLASMVEAEFRYVYGDSVAAVNPVWDQSELEPLCAEYTRIRTRLEDYLDWAATRIRRRQPLRPKHIRIIPLAYPGWGTELFGVKPVRVDALHFWTQRLQYLVGQMAEARTRGHRATPAAFVTFNSRVAQVVSASSLHQHVEVLWRVQPAPDAGEVLWPNVRMRHWERALRQLGAGGLFFGLLCVYFIPVAAIQGLIAIPKLASDKVVNAPALVALVQAIAPALGLKVFMVFIPYLLDLLVRLGGPPSESAVDFAVVRLAFGFQLVAFFLGSLISGSFLNQLQRLLNEPSDILHTLATSVPQTSTFFITYTLVASLGAYAIDFLRPVQLVVFLLRSRLVSTPRQRARLWADRYVKYSWNLPDNMIVFLLGLVFCIINPIMCVVVMSYFSIVLLFERFNNLYVYKRKYDSGGRVWSVIFHQLMAAVYIMQILLMLVVSLRSLTLFLLILPAVAATGAFHVLCTRAFSRPWNVLSLHDASFVDRKDQMQRAARGGGGQGGGEALSEAEKVEIREMYLSPMFKISPADIEELLVEAEKVRRLVAGESLDSILHDFQERGLAHGSPCIPGDGEEEPGRGPRQGQGQPGGSSEDDGDDFGCGKDSKGRSSTSSGSGGRGGAAAAAAAQQQQQRQRRVRFAGDVEAEGLRASGGDGGAATTHGPVGHPSSSSSWWSSWSSWLPSIPGGGWTSYWRRAPPAAPGATAAAEGMQLAARRGSGDGGGGDAANFSPEAALALVSALVAHVSAMGDAGRRQLQEMLAPPLGGGVGGVVSGAGTAAAEQRQQREECKTDALFSSGPSWAGPGPRARRKAGGR